MAPHGRKPCPTESHLDRGIQCEAARYRGMRGTCEGARSASRQFTAVRALSLHATYQLTVETIAGPRDDSPDVATDRSASGLYPHSVAGVRQRETSPHPLPYR